MDFVALALISSEMNIEGREMNGISSGILRNFFIQLFYVVVSRAVILAIRAWILEEAPPVMFVTRLPTSLYVDWRSSSYSRGIYTGTHAGASGSGIRRSRFIDIQGMIWRSPYTRLPALVV